MTYEPRTYRSVVEPAGLITLRGRLKETDLQISATSDLTEPGRGPRRAGARGRSRASSPRIRASPRRGRRIDVPDDAPDARACDGASAAHLARVGPMAAVAGVVAEYVAQGPPAALGRGDRGERRRRLPRRRRRSAWSRCGRGTARSRARSGCASRAGCTPLAVCTSSGTVGHSTSLGAARRGDGARARRRARGRGRDRARQPGTFGRGRPARDRRVPGHRTASSVCSSSPVTISARGATST